MIRRSLLCIRSKSHDQWWKKKNFFRPLENRKRNSSLLTHNVTLVPRGYLRKRNRGDQASIRPWRLANYYNYRNWRCAIRPGKGQSCAPLRGYPSPSPSHQPDFHPCVPCIDYKYHDRVITHTCNYTSYRCRPHYPPSFVTFRFNRPTLPIHSAIGRERILDVGFLWLAWIWGESSFRGC